MDAFQELNKYKLTYADALYAHSWMENKLSELFTFLLNCNYAEGSLVFYNMDYRRYKVISDLIKTKYPDYQLAWKKLSLWIYNDDNSITTIRNKIVHWRMVEGQSDRGLANPYKDATLLESMKDGFDKIETISYENLVDFTVRTFMISHIIYQFSSCISCKDYEKKMDVFKDIPKGITPDIWMKMIHDKQT